jgi:hypothetical protein
MEADNIKYVVIGARDTATLSKQVNEYIDNGWRPIGSHQVTVDSIDIQHNGTRRKYMHRYTQTLVRD